MSLIQFGLICTAGGVIAGSFLGYAIKSIIDAWQDEHFITPTKPTDLVRTIKS